jgi:hypothetical protein
MQKTIAWIVFLFIQITLLSQNYNDIIVLKTGDTVFCNITKVNSKYLYYNAKGGDLTDLTYVLTSDVEKYFQSGTIVETPESTNPQTLFFDKKLRIGITGGYSNRLARIPSGIDESLLSYYKDLKSGFNYGLDFTYYFNYRSGIGIKFNKYRSIVSPIDIYIELPDGTIETGKMSDDVTIRYLGLAYSFKGKAAQNTGWFFGDVGFGLLGYRDNAVLIDNLLIEGNTFGYNVDFGYDFRLSEGLALGFQISLFTGILTSVDVTMDEKKETVDLEEDSYEGLGRFDISVALRFLK